MYKRFFPLSFFLHQKFILLSLSMIGILSFALFHKNAWIPSKVFFETLWTPDPSLAKHILLQFRLPRICSAFVVGGLLALSGCLMQALLQNPLADPYILGISGGSAAGAVLCLTLGLSPHFMILGGWLGGLCIIVLVWLLTFRHAFYHSNLLLLTGIALGSLSLALVNILLLFNHTALVRGIFFWMMGDLNGRSWPKLSGCILIFGLVYSLFLSKQLNILRNGNLQAATLGIEVKYLHRKLYLLASLLTATAVTLGGCIGFIGLIVPHLVRMKISYQYQWLLPCSVLVGGFSLIFADTCAQTLIAPIVLPVGVMITCVGIPIFLFLLKKNLNPF